MAGFAAAVGTAVVSAVVEKLISFTVDEAMKVANALKQDAFLDEIGSLDRKLKVVRELLDDAEAKQIKSSGIRAWLSELKDAAYEAEDVLDEYSTDAALLLQRKGHVRTIIKAKVKQIGLLNRIKFTNKRFDTLRNEMKDLGLQKLEMSNQGSQNEARGREITSLLDVDSPVIGREDVKHEIVKLLTLSDGESYITKLHVLPIVGMGGVGKTSLAQLVFHDNDVKEYFDIRIWVFVSQNFDLIKILKEMTNYNGLESLEYLHNEVVRLIERKKLLLVLDDVWNENPYLWEQLLKPLKLGDSASKVVLTTRSHNVVRSINGHIDPINLKGLHNEHIWDILKKSAFGNASPEKYSDLTEISAQIVEKLVGCPLAAKTVGRLLSTSLDIVHWKRVLKSEIWELEGQLEHDILPSLMLSYQYLSPTLKQCFLLCSLFPKGYIFSDDHLAYIWMAHDIFHAKTEMRPEDCARDAIRELISRSFFQVDKHGLLSMHNLIHDVSEYAAQEELLRIDYGVKPKKYPVKLRHLSFSDLDMDNDVSFHKLRTVLSIGYQDGYTNVHGVLPGWLKESTSLRALGLRKCRCSELLDSVSILKHLRYLDLSDTEISELPKSLTSLYNLQFLSVNECPKLTEFPSSIGNLRHLRNLDLSHTGISELPKSLTSLHNLQVLMLEYTSLSKLPDGMDNLVNLKTLEAETELLHTIDRIGRMTSLRWLKSFNVDKVNGWGIEELKNLDMLQGSLTITSLENVSGHEEARKANLQRKVYLAKLALEWSEGSIVDVEIAEGVLEALRPCDYLEYLEIDGYIGKVLPSWLYHDPADISHVLGNLKSLKSLKLYGNVESLSTGSCPQLSNVVPQSGYLPASLECFYIKNCGVYDQSLMTSLYGLTSLQQLLIEDCPNLFEPLEKELVTALMEKTLRSFNVGGSNWGFHFYVSKGQDSIWKLEIKWPAASFQDAISISRWAWDLLLEIVRHFKQHFHELHIYDSEIISMDGDLQELFFTLTNLSQLKFSNCKQLLSLPNSSLPSSLSMLLIKDCPLLMERYNMKSGPDWPLISHVSKIVLI